MRQQLQLLMERQHRCRQTHQFPSTAEHCLDADDDPFMLDILFQSATYLAIYLALRIMAHYFRRSKLVSVVYTTLGSERRHHQQLICKHQNNSRMIPTSNNSSSVLQQQEETLKYNNNFSESLSSHITHEHRRMTEASASPANHTLISSGVRHVENKPLCSNNSSKSSAVDSISVGNEVPPPAAESYSATVSFRHDSNYYYNKPPVYCWPPRKVALIDNFIQKALNSNLVILWKRHEISMELYMDFYPGPPSMRRRLCRRTRGNQIVLQQANHERKKAVLLSPSPSPPSPSINRSTRNNTWVSSSLSSTPSVSSLSSSYRVEESVDDNSRSRHKLYLFAHDVLQYYQSRYGSQRGTHEAERIIFLRQTISNFTG